MINALIWLRGDYAKPEFVATLRESDYPDVPHSIEGVGPSAAHAIADLEAQIEALQ